MNYTPIRQQNNNPNTLNFATVLHTIETQVSEHSLHGMFFAFIAGILGNVQHISPSPTSFDTVVKVIANLSIILGFLIALITFAVKCKEMHTTFFKNKELPVIGRKRNKSA